MLTKDVDPSSISNLAITDHLPADIIRSLWLIQSLNMRLNDRREQLSHSVSLFEALSKLQRLASSRESRFSSAGAVPVDLDRVDDHNNPHNNNSSSSTNPSASHENLERNLGFIEEQKNTVLQSVRSIDADIRAIHSESIREAVKLRLLLDSAKRFLNAFSYQLIYAIFTHFWSKAQLRPFVQDIQPDKHCVKQVDASVENLYPNLSSPSLAQLNKTLRNNTSFQRRNDQKMLTRFSDCPEEFQTLIVGLMETKSPNAVGKDREDFSRTQLLLSIMAKNDTFDKCFNLNGHHQPKVKLVIRKPGAPVGTSSSKAPRKLKLDVNSRSELSSLFSDEDSTEGDFSRLSTPKLKLTFKGLAQSNSRYECAIRGDSLGPADDLDDYIDVAAESLGMESVSTSYQLNKSPKSTKTRQKRTTKSKSDVQVESNSLLVEDTQLSAFESTAAGDEEVYCVCRTGSSGKMIGCDDENCPYGGWFHYKCIGLPNNFSPPKNQKWYCPWCKPKHLPGRQRKHTPSQMRLPLPNVEPRENGLSALTPVVPPIKRKRGRPRKYPLSVEITTVGSQNGNAAGIKIESNKNLLITNKTQSPISGIGSVFDNGKELLKDNNSISANPQSRRGRRKTMSVLGAPRKRSLRSLAADDDTKGPVTPDKVLVEKSKPFTYTPRRALRSAGTSDISLDVGNASFDKSSASSRMLSQLYASYNAVEGVHPSSAYYGTVSSKKRNLSQLNGELVKKDEALSSGPPPTTDEKAPSEVLPLPKKRKSRIVDQITANSNLAMLQVDKNSTRSKRANRRFHPSSPLSLRKSSRVSAEPPIPKTPTKLCDSIVDQFIAEEPSTPLSPLSFSDSDI